MSDLDIFLEELDDDTKCLVNDFMFNPNTDIRYEHLPEEAQKALTLWEEANIIMRKGDFDDLQHNYEVSNETEQCNQTIGSC